MTRAKYKADGSLTNHARYADAMADAMHRARRDLCFYRMQKSWDGKTYDVYRCPKGDDGLYHGAFQGRLIGPREDEVNY